MAEQSNITLRFDAEDGGAKQALLEMDKTERKLDATVKVGNKTLRERINTEADLAKVLDKVKRGEEQAMTAGQRRAKASLAAQKSAALLAKMQADAAREQRMATGWEMAAARAQLEADRRNHERLMRRKREMDAATNASRGSLNEIAVVAKTTTASLAAMGGTVGAIRAVANEVARINEALVQSAQSANATAESIKEFVAIQAPGPGASAVVGGALLTGAEFGVKPGQAADLAQTIQSINDTDGNGKLEADQQAAFDTDYKAALKLIEAGVAQEDAKKIITAGKARGQSGAVSADMMAKAAALSALGPSDVSKSISATSEFSNQTEALSILTALSKEQTETGKLPAAMERLGIVLGASGEVGETAKFSKKYGLLGLSETEKIEKLRKYGAQHGKGKTEAERIRSFTATLPGEEGLAKETAIDLARVIRQSDTAQATKSELKSGAAGEMDKIIAANLASPITGPGMLANRQAALAEVSGIIGPQSEKAQAALARRQIEGAAMLAEGDVANVNPDGTAKPFLERTWGAWGKRALEGMGRSASVGYGAGPSVAQIEAQNRISASQPQPTAEGLIQVQQELVDQLKKNNALLQENNQVTAAANTAGGTKLAGGAATNAEERY